MELKQDKMTADERWIALLNRKPVDRMAIWGMALGFSAVNVGYNVFDFYYDAHKTFDAIEKTTKMYSWQPFALHAYGSMPCDTFGGSLKPPAGRFIQSPLPYFPVQSEEDGWNLKKPDIRTAPGLEHLAMDVAKMADEHHFETFHQAPIQDPWTSATMVTGVDVLCKWTKTKPDLAHHILKTVLGYCIDKAQWFVDTFGAERVIGGEALASAANQIIGPKTFEEFVLPYMLEFHKAMIAMGIKHIFIHICGYQALNYPMLAELPMGDPGIISVAHDVDADWPDPLASAAKFFPNDILYGNIEPAQFQIGTPEEIYRRAQHCIEIGKKHEPGLILGTGCELPPNSIPYNVYMMTQAVNDFGWYD